MPPAPLYAAAGRLGKEGAVFGRAERRTSTP